MDYMLTGMQTVALAVCGMCHALLGSVKVPLAKKLSIDEARVGGLVSVFGFTLIPMVLIFGFLVDAIGKQAVLGAGFGLIIVSLITFSRLRTYPIAMLAVLLLGVGWSALVNVLNVTTPRAFVPEELLKERMSFAMNLGDFIFGMGAFLMPLLVAYLIRKVRLEKTFLVISLFEIVPVLIGFGVKWENLVDPQTETVAGGMKILLSDSVVWLCCIAFFFHVPIEASVATWATTLMTDKELENKRISDERAAMMLSLFWLTFTFSRLVTALALPHADPILIIVLGALGIVFTVLLAKSRNGNLTAWLVVVIGGILGPIFPTLIAILLGHVESSLHGRAVGIFFCIGGIGWTVIPMLIGAYAKKMGVRRAFGITTGCAVVLTILSVVLYLTLK